MSTDLVLISSRNPSPNKEESQTNEPNEKDLHHRFSDLYDQLREKLKASGHWPYHPDSDPLQTTAEALHMAGWDWAAWWERRAKRVERQLKDLLASDALTGEQREGILGALYGPKSSRDAQLLSKKEAELIGWYRAMDAGERAAVRTISQRFVCGRASTESHSEVGE